MELQEKMYAGHLNNYTNDLQHTVFRCGSVLIEFTHIQFTFLTRLLVNLPHGNINRMALMPHGIHDTSISPFTNMV